MSVKTPGSRGQKQFGRRKDLHRIIIAKGDKVTSVTIHPLIAATAGLVTLGLAIAYLGATAYLMFRDDLIHASRIQQVRLQNAYEDQLASLRIEIDRITSRQMLDQKTVEKKLDRLLGLRASLDQRQKAVFGLTKTANAAGLSIPALAPEPRPHPKKSAHAALPAPDGLNVDRITTASAYSRPTAPVAAQIAINRNLRLENGTFDLKRIETDLRNEQVAQVQQLKMMANETVVSSERIAGVLRSLGFRAPKNVPHSAEAIGGPFIAAEPVDPLIFENSVSALEENIQHLNKLKRTVRKLPLLSPIKNGIVSSNFGRRVDPFFRRYAMHSGIDYKAKTGTPVRATAPGKVVKASWNGGYGRLVEIEHVGGIRTRYAHLSRISVSVGQRVASGDMIGRVGSTGRSTGPHLHYETRIDKKAVNPKRFMKAGQKIRSVL